MLECNVGASYEGQGKLIWAGGEVDECDFRVEHDLERGIFLHCSLDEPNPFRGPGDKATGFEGETSDGEYKVVAEGEILLANTLFGIGETGGYTHSTLLLRALRVSRDDQLIATRLRFGLTNFKFFGIEAIDGRLVLPLRLQSGSTEARAYIAGVEGHDAIVKVMEATRGVQVTSEAVFDIDQDMDKRQVEETVENLCYILSVARGTKVQWVYCHEYGQQGNPIRKYHCNRVTKRFTSSSSLINDGAEGRYQTRQFIEMIYPVYVQKRDLYLMNRGLLDAYLEAKSGDDHIERRAIKLAVSLEMLKDLFLKSSGCPVDELIMDKKVFRGIAKQLRTAIEEILRDAKIEVEDINSVCGKINELNRTSFKQILKSLFETIGFCPEEEEIGLFVKCRNELVHTGQFYRPSETERRFIYFNPPSPEENGKGNDYLAGYLFIVNFLDRVFLKLLGYNGPYINHKLFSPTVATVGFPDHLS